ncbi:MAG: M15 family metallopeptidase [Flavobacteriaceae bacterium]
MNRAQFLASLFASPIFIRMFQTESPYSHLMGKGHPELVGDGYALTPAAATAFEKMKQKAHADGIRIEVVSSYRSYDQQLRIWNRKFEKFKSEGLEGYAIIDAITEYSTLPGTSRHHWGTEIDLIDADPPKVGDVLLPEKFHDGGPYEKLRLWLEDNATSFGFLKPYTDHPDRSGFAYEPWHYSYAAEAIPNLDTFLKIPLQAFSATENLLGNELLTASYLTKYFEEYVMGISEALR